MPGPPLTRDQVAAMLRRLRVEFDPDLSVSAAARRVSSTSDVSLHQTTLKRLEDGRHVPTEAQMTALLNLYRADGWTRSQMLASARERWGSRQQQVVMHAGATTAQRRIGEAEARAVRVTGFSPTVVPGLLQSSGYLRAVGSTALTGADLDGWIGSRPARQHQMPELDTEYVLLTTSAALVVGLGGPDVMREQIRHLVDVTRSARIRFGVVPAGACLSRHLLHGFDVLDNPDGSRLIHYGTHSGVVTVSEPSEQQEMLDVLADVERAAVFGIDARSELDRMAELYRSPHSGESGDESAAVKAPE